VCVSGQFQQNRIVMGAAALCGILTIFGWWSTEPAFRAAPFQDWAVFHTAAMVYRQYGSWQAIFAHWPLQGHPWLYPPSFLLLLLPFGYLSSGLACAIFLLATSLALFAALWRYAGMHRALHIAAVFLSPAAMINFYLGQNAFLSAAFIGGGAMMVKRRPVAAGVLFGLLSYKPQLMLLVPVALLAARSWKTLASATATGLLLVAVSTAVFGVDAWRSWIEMAGGGSDLTPLATAGRLSGASVFACAMLFGAAPPVATALQALATVIAAGAVYISWRSQLPEELKLAVLFAATVFGAPHATGYDALLVAFAASLLFVHGIEHHFRPGEAVIALLAWSYPLITPPVLHPLGRLAPAVVAVTIVVAMIRGLRLAETAAPLV
jgi:hypothetical protein